MINSQDTRLITNNILPIFLMPAYELENVEEEKFIYCPTWIFMLINNVVVSYIKWTRGQI